jgi:hypothetical protein
LGELAKTNEKSFQSLYSRGHVGKISNGHKQSEP